MPTFISFSQFKPSVGINIPLLIDNQLEISYQKNIHKRIRVIGTIGGTSNSRNKFKNSSYTIDPFIPQGNDFSLVANSDKVAGFYGKIGFNFIFNLPDFFYTGDKEEGSNFRFFVGPLLGISSFKQTGNLVKTYFNQTDNLGKPLGVFKPSETTTFEEKGVLTGTGFSTGISIAAMRDISADIGLDFLGFSRKSKFQYQSNTPGLGTSLLIRVNYNIGGKK